MGQRHPKVFLMFFFLYMFIMKFLSEAPSFPHSTSVRCGENNQQILALNTSTKLLSHAPPLGNPTEISSMRMRYHSACGCSNINCRVYQCISARSHRKFLAGGQRMSCSHYEERAQSHEYRCQVAYCLNGNALVSLRHFPLLDLHSGDEPLHILAIHLCPLVLFKQSCHITPSALV